MREIQIDRDEDGKPTRMRFGGDDLAGPLPERRQLREHEPCEHPGCLHHVSHPCEGCGRTAGRYVGEVLVPLHILAPDSSGEPRIWERHPTEPERDHGGAAGVCIYVRPAMGEDYAWIRSDGARRFFERRDALRALARKKRVTVGDLIDAVAR